MALYAAFDATVPAPSPVLGWYDTGFTAYPSLPDAGDLLAMTPAQWASRSTGSWAVAGGSLVSYTPPAPVLTLAQQASAALVNGLAVTSASNPSLNGTYACDATAQAHIMAEMISLTVSSGATFADGTNSIVWPNITGSFHTWTPAQFQPFALAIGAYVSGLYKCISGVSTTLPAAAVTIP